MNESKTIQLHDEAEGIEIELIVTRFNETESGVEQDAGYRVGRVVYTLIGPGVEKSSHDTFKLRDETAFTDRMNTYLFDKGFAELEHGERIEV